MASSRRSETAHSSRPGEGGAWSFAQAWLRWSYYVRDAWVSTAATPQALAQTRNGRFASLVAFAARESRLYRKLYGKPSRSPPPPDALPPVTKPALMAAFDDWVTDREVTLERARGFIADPACIGRPFLGRHSVWTSSGTTGVPAIFVQDADTLAVYDALTAARNAQTWPWQAAGDFWRLAMSGARLALVAATEGHFAGVATWERLRATYPWAAAGARVFPVTEPMSQLVADLERFAPAFLASYPTTLRVLAEAHDAGRMHLSPVSLWSGGEGCSPATRAAIEEAFGCRLVEDYGASEFMAIAWQCERGALHVNSDWVLLEPVDEKGRPVPPGTPSASVLLTNLSNRVQPLIRYDLGDSVTIARHACDCGSPFPVVRVEGRQGDILRLADSSGRRIPLLPLAIGTVIEEETGVHQYQVVQTAPAAITLRADVPRAQAAAFQMIGRRALDNYLARNRLANVRVSVEVGALPEAAPSGKLRRVVRAERRR